MEIFFNRMEKVFGVRSLIFQNEFLMLETIRIDSNSYGMNLYLIFNNDGVKQMLLLREEEIKDKKELIELKRRMVRLEKDYKQAMKGGKDGEKWYNTILTELIRMGIKYETHDYLIALNCLQKNILRLENCIVFENSHPPHDTKFFSYDNLNELFIIIEKEQRKTKIGNMYDK